MTSVTAGLITAQGVVEFLEFEEGAPGLGLVTVDITYCGICGSDIASFRSGHLLPPSVCGHEWVGTVVEVGAGVTHPLAGDRVVIAVPPACGQCPECMRGFASHCRSSSAVAGGKGPFPPPHGGFARQITVEASRVMVADPALTDEEAAQVEPATLAFHAVRRARVNPGDTVVVQGAGPIGLFAAQFARAAGAGDVVVIEPSAGRRQVALDIGASSALVPRDAAESLHELTAGAGADVVIECSGVPALLQNAVELARSGGLVSLVSFMPQPATINADRWLGKEITVTASRSFVHDDFRRSMRMIVDGRIICAPLHTRTVELEDLETALIALATEDADDIKVLVDPRL